MTNIASTVEKCYRELLGASGRNDPVDMNRRLIEQDGFSSLQLVTFVTEVCEASDIPLTVLTEQDIAKMKTANDIVSILQKASEAGSQA